MDRGALYAGPMNRRCVVAGVLVAGVLALGVSAANDTDCVIGACVRDGSERMQIPDCYTVSDFYRSPLAGLSRITRSVEGTIYVQVRSETDAIRIAQLDVDAETLAPVIDFVREEPSSFPFGGPEDSFFIRVGREIRQYEPDGSYTVWGTFDGGFPMTYTPDGRILGLDMDRVFQIHPNGSTTLIADGFESAEDVVADSAGNIYVADWMAGTLTKITPQGQKSKLCDIIPDNVYIAFDSQERLFVTGVPAYPFAMVDTTTGQVTKAYPTDEPDCSILAPANFVLADEKQVVFASWAGGRLSQLDTATGTGAMLIDVLFANTNAAVLSPDGEIVIAVRECTATGRTTDIVSFDETGTPSTWLSNLPGLVGDIDFAPDGTFWFTLLADHRTGLYAVESGTTEHTLIPGTQWMEFPSMAVDPTTGHAVCSTFQPTDDVMVVYEYDETGQVATYTFDLPYPSTGPVLRFDPDGRLFGAAADVETLTSGPVVERWIYQFDLESEITTVVAQSNLNHCCPMFGLSIDGDGNQWWTHNPDFQLFRIDPDGTMDLFACYIPIDTSQTLRNADGDLFLINPSGILKLTREE